MGAKVGLCDHGMIRLLETMPSSGVSRTHAANGQEVDECAFVDTCVVLYCTVQYLDLTLLTVFSGALYVSMTMSEEVRPTRLLLVSRRTEKMLSNYVMVMLRT